MRVLDERAAGRFRMVRVGCCSQCSTDVVKCRVFSALRPRCGWVALFRDRRWDACDTAGPRADAARATPGCRTGADSRCGVGRVVAARSHSSQEVAKSGHARLILTFQFLLRNAVHCLPTAWNDERMCVSTRARTIRACEEIVAIPDLAPLATERTWRLQRLARSNSRCGVRACAFASCAATLAAAANSAINASGGAPVGDDKQRGAIISFKPSATGGCGRICEGNSIGGCGLRGGSEVTSVAGEFARR
jgi:hypothetical protein